MKTRIKLQLKASGSKSYVPQCRRWWVWCTIPGQFDTKEAAEECLTKLSMPIPLTVTQTVYLTYTMLERRSWGNDVVYRPHYKAWFGWVPFTKQSQVLGYGFASIIDYQYQDEALAVMEAYLNEKVVRSGILTQ